MEFNEDTREKLRIAQSCFEERIRLEQEFKDAKIILKKFLPGRRVIKKEEKYEEVLCLDRNGKDTLYYEIKARDKGQFGEGWSEHYTLNRIGVDGKDINLISSASGGGYRQEQIYIKKAFWDLEGM